MVHTFEGWPAEATALLAEIAADNTRRPGRSTGAPPPALLGPTLALAAELNEEFGPVRVFRPHVDRRFRPERAAVAHRHRAWRRRAGRPR